MQHRILFMDHGYKVALGLAMYLNSKGLFLMDIFICICSY